MGTGGVGITPDQPPLAGCALAGMSVPWQGCVGLAALSWLAGFSLALVFALAGGLSSSYADGA